MTGCEKYYLSLKREVVDQNSLASTFVGSPDPRQKHPPHGQELVLEWRLPPQALGEPLTLNLHVLYGDMTEGVFHYPVNRQRGIETYRLLDPLFGERKGFISYRAEIANQDGEVIKEWQQKLWTKLITVDEL